MIIDNWDLLRDKLDFSDEDKFYFIELMQRKKDNPEFPQNNRMVKYYFVYSLEYFDRVKNEVKQICDATMARAYLLLNRRSYKKCSLQVLSDITKMVIDDNYLHFPKIISSVIGRYSDELNKNWIIDIDEIKDIDFGLDFSGNKVLIKNWQVIADYINNLEPYGPKLKFIVPTLHGVHLIVKPFNCSKFKEMYPDIDVHKDNPTLLYFNNQN